MSGNKSPRTYRVGDYRYSAIAKDRDITFRARLGRNRVWSFTVPITSIPVTCQYDQQQYFLDCMRKTEAPEFEPYIEWIALANRIADQLRLLANDTLAHS